MAENPAADIPSDAMSTANSVIPDGGGVAGDVTDQIAVDEIDEEFARLVDQLLPPERSPRRRLVTGFVVVGGAAALAVAWALGYVVPNPTYLESSSSSNSLVAVEEPDLVALTGLWFRNSSRTTLTLADVEIDAPGLTLDRLEWYIDGRDGGTSDRVVEETFDDDGGSVTVTENEAMEVAGSFLDMRLRSDVSQPFPAVIGPGESAQVIAYMRVDDCSKPIVEPSGTWGTVHGRWQYPNRPSWWRRWEAFDQPLQVDDGDLQLHDFVASDGEHVDADGPLSGACEALEARS